MDQNLSQNSRIERICTDTMLGIKVGKNQEKRNKRKENSKILDYEESEQRYKCTLLDSLYSKCYYMELQYWPYISYKSIPLGK